MDLINEYTKLKKISAICKENNISYSNIKYGKCSQEQLQIIENAVKEELRDLFSKILIK